MQQPLLRTTTIEGDLDPHLKIFPGESILIISRDQSYLTHGFHKYPTKFFPELPRWAIQKYSRVSDWILDPMAGSGTVNVESLLLKRNSIAIDVDPFARLLTRVKTTPLVEDVLLETQRWLLEFIRDGRMATKQTLPEFPYRDNWFSAEILQELNLMRYAIEKMPLMGLSSEEGNKYRDLYRICMSSVVRSVSNADDNCTRTVIRKKLNKQVPAGKALSLFRKAVETNISRMIEFSRTCPRGYEVIIKEEGDARNTNLPDNCVDLAVTSPPYINACDYTRTHQLEMYWLGILNGDQVLAELKRKYIGTEAVRAEEYRNLHSYGNPLLDSLLTEIFQRDARRSFIIYQYFVDMRNNLAEVKRVLKRGSRYVIVVGNNVIRGLVIPTQRILIDIAEELGYKTETYYSSEVIRHFIKVPRTERINNDWVIVLQTV